MTIMTSWDLFDDLRSAQDEVVRQSRMPGRWYGLQSASAPAGQAWAPAIDIAEREDAYLVTAELPGVGTGDVEITFQDGLLTIQGERHSPLESAGEKVHRSERRYGAFRRSITLPSHVQSDKIEASAQDGVLEPVVPKAQDAHARRIRVGAGMSKAAVNGTAVNGIAVKKTAVKKNAVKTGVKTGA
jgi:HSP20 family protein